MTQTRETTKHQQVNQDSWSLEQDLNPVPPKHEARYVHEENICLFELNEYQLACGCKYVENAAYQFSVCSLEE
jgi:hypothetical protein